MATSMKKAAITPVEFIVLSGLTGLLGDYLYHDSEWAIKYNIKQTMQSKQSTSLQPLIAPFNNNFAKLDKVRLKEPSAIIVVSADGVGKSSTLHMFADNEKIQEDRKTVIIPLRTNVRFRNDSYQTISDNIFQSLGVPKRSSYAKTTYELLRNITTYMTEGYQPGNLDRKLNQERVNTCITLLFDSAKEIYEENIKSAKTETQQNSKVNIIFDDYDYLLSNPELKKTGGLSLFSTIAYLTSIHLNSSQVYLSGASTTTYFEALRRTNLNQIPNEVVTFEDCKEDIFESSKLGREGATAHPKVIYVGIDGVEKDVSKVDPNVKDPKAPLLFPVEVKPVVDMSAKELLASKGYSAKEITRILSVFGTRLVDLSYFLTQHYSEAEIEARIDSKAAGIITILNHLIMKQKEQHVKSFINLCDYLNKHSRQDTLNSSELNKCFDEFRKNTSPDFRDLASSILMYQVTDGTQNDDTFTNGQFKFQSPVIAYVWNKEHATILKKVQDKQTLNRDKKKSINKKFKKNDVVNRTWSEYLQSWF